MRIVDKIELGQVLISDGAWGTFLQKKGLQPGECPELWCLDHRDAVLDIAKSYVLAGADMIETNSFGANGIKLRHYGLEARASELNEAAAAISREAAGSDRHVLGSIGPTGAILMTGDVTPEEMYAAFRDQAVALERGGADALCIETMSAIDEAGIAVRAARATTGCEIICTFTFERTVDGDFRTMMGVTPEEMACEMAVAGAHCIGANCGNGMERMIDIVKRLRSCSALPILVHANAGLPEVIDGAVRYRETPRSMAALVPALVAAGANIVGGCCGTTPAHIRAIAESRK